MSNRSMVSNVSLRQKVRCLSILQTAFLLLLTGLGWMALQRSSLGARHMVERNPRLKVLNELRFQFQHTRAGHQALLAGANNRAFAPDFIKYVGTSEATLAMVMQDVRNQPWEEDEAPKVRECLEAIQTYLDGFRVSFAKAREDSRGLAVPGLIREGGTSLGRARALMTELFDLQNAKNDQSQKDNELTTAASYRAMAAALVAAILLGALLSRAITRRTIGGVDSLARTMSALAQGDLSAPCPVGGRDELGRMSADLNAVVARFRASVRTIDDAARHLVGVSTNLALRASLLSSTSTALEADAAHQKAGVDEIARALASMSTTIGLARSAAGEAESKARTALQVTEHGREKVAETIRATQAIRLSSDKVGQVTVVITEIAKQTNLLALNAAIEASKAGTQGKGFAVVAEEVRKLAERAGSAATKINALVEDSRQSVGAGQEAVAGVDESLGFILAAVRENESKLGAIHQGMEAQSRSARDMVVHMEGTAGRVEGSTLGIRKLAGAAQEVKGTVQDVAALAQELQGLTRQFTLA